jgi:putative transposase
VRRTASEKMEIIRLVEGTDLPVRATLRQMNIPRSTFYNWYRRYVEQGFDGLHDKKPARRSRWNAIPEEIQEQILELALERTDLSPRELACRYTDEKRYFVSESSVYRLLKQADLTQCRFSGLLLLVRHLGTLLGVTDPGMCLLA